MDWLNAIKFDKNGLIPAIAQDHATGQILMMAWMNREALILTATSKQAVYFSRSRNKLWHKGESSGHFQQVHAIRLDCDSDVIVLSVTQIGAIACHTGRTSCFYQLLINEQDKFHWQITDPVKKDPSAIYNTDQSLPTNNNTLPNQHTIQTDQTADTKQSAHLEQTILEKLDTVLNERKQADANHSYAASLYQKGLNKILEKVGEEATETIIAAKELQAHTNDDNRHNLIYEIADVWFHTMVVLAWFNIPITAVTDELARRFGLSGIDEKNARSQA
ncbi:phosphoribosyl-AMP cyclohydrolase / phosphoribosyl-ATP pyrophosphatase [Moraxella macacae 0408225]|uniref:Histidine biosynthesis bifunctional protein HisIE n=1 Tax=Moraxella macacae 0408225 TaxID=1230338 RepID=L2F847_9GAMM|nr:bifunctional phosphoribosyl-AMP cyclohydrolase/phosphoribosyl-ATP diphosphatase HisIE [Moraxella macacae]ELA08956.1 phosphoribosyl-AMP cyclohydrolase / phosphoribosyl-ATP pyrophosphatase [Moraxella macacae 0408225]